MHAVAKQRRVGSGSQNHISLAPVLNAPKIAVPTFSLLQGPRTPGRISDFRMRCNSGSQVVLLNDAEHGSSPKPFILPRFHTASLILRSDQRTAQEV